MDNEPAPAPTVPDAAEESKAPGALKESFGDVLYRRRITAVMLLIMVLAAVGKFGFLSSQVWCKWYRKPGGGGGGTHLVMLARAH
mgnify:CR=1 FL=1